ncbi:uncharacterized protein LOC112097619, partial [Citrus clementina]|uniref:uncharacterized protein LOC112097619 n=1 Tax=Citrus clementina TaxID=85681 RepID=UPI000CED5A60
MPFLVDELQCHYNEYTLLLGYASRSQELLHSLSYFEPNPRYDHWMIMPNTGYLIASKYSVIVLLISMQQYLTILPLRSIPETRSSHKIIAIGYIYGCHFIEVFMQPASPIPPIRTKWFKYHHQCAE